MKQLRSLVLVLLISAGACKKENTNVNAPYVLFPAGRSFLGASTISVTINSKAYTLDRYYDMYGGFWIKIPRDSIVPNAVVEVQYQRWKEDVLLFKETKNDLHVWLEDSYYIDASNNLIKAKAAALTNGTQSNIEKAVQIQNYVIKNMTYNVYRNSFEEKASKTLELNYGSCMNYSRLFIALCRAVNIPARSIWGIVYGHDDDGVYDYHHQWAEILDNDGFWHTLDLSYSTNFNMADVRYLDLLYGAEENPVLTNSLYEIHLGNVSYFHNYPAALTGKLGFTLLEDNRPDYMTVRYRYQF